MSVDNRPRTIVLAGVMALGVALVMLGLAVWSVPAACVLVGVVLFISGGLEVRRGAK